MAGDRVTPLSYRPGRRARTSATTGAANLRLRGSELAFTISKLNYIPYGDFCQKKIAKIYGEKENQIRRDRVRNIQKKKSWLIYQFYNLIPALTVEQNILLPACICHFWNGNLPDTNRWDLRRMALKKYSLLNFLLSV